VNDVDEQPGAPRPGTQPPGSQPLPGIEATPGPPPDTGATDRMARRRRLVRVARLAAVVAVLATGAVAAVVSIVGVGPPSEQQLRDDAGLVGKRELLIGVKDDQPGTSLRDPATGQFAGFEIEIALLVAAELGFRPAEVRFLPMESEDRASRQARTTDGRFVTVDLVIATYSITAARESDPGVTFSAPYLVTEQSVVTRREHPPVDTLTDLAGRPVCSLATATSESPAGRAGVRLISKKRISECFAALSRGEVEAVTTDAAILAGFVAQRPDDLVHHDIGLEQREAWGINVGPNDALRDLVNLALYRSRNDPGDKRWEDAFDRYLRVEQPANLPQQVAIDEQPDVQRVEVREWPWERRAG
jgi:glutamate transport system substrate-binding protein